MNKLLYLLLFISATAFAQRQSFKGKVVTDHIPLKDIFVIDKSTGFETKTDADGLFRLDIRPGEKLAVYSDRTEVREFTVSKEWFDQQPFELDVKLKGNELKEVVVEDKIDNKSLGLDTSPNLTPAERRKKANKLVGTNQGLSINGDGIINRVTGKSKTIKQSVNTEDKITAVENLRNMYTDDEFYEEFAIPLENVEGFIYYAAENFDCMIWLKANNRAKAKPYLQPLAVEYLNRLADEK